MLVLVSASLCCSFLTIGQAPPSLPLRHQLQVQHAGSLRAGRVALNLAPDKKPATFGVPEEIAQPLGLLFTLQFLLFIGVGAVIPTIPLYGKAIGLSSAVNGIVIGAPAVALLTLARPAGEFADRARKPAMLGGMALITFADIGTATAGSLAPLVAARLALGAGRCVSESGERGFLADLAGRAPLLRGKLLAGQQVAAALGIAIGAPLGGVVVETYGPRAAFLCVSAAAAVTFCGYLLLPETTGAVPSEAVERSEEESAGGWLGLLREPNWQGLALCEAATRFGYAAKIASVPVIAAAVLPGGAAGAGALLSAAGLSGLVGAPFGGWLTDRTGAPFTAVSAGVLSGVSLLLVPAALRMGALAGLPDGAAFAALVMLWSVGVAAQGPALQAIGQQLAPKGAEATSLALPRVSIAIRLNLRPQAAVLVAHDIRMPLCRRPQVTACP